MESALKEGDISAAVSFTTPSPWSYHHRRSHPRQGRPMFIALLTGTKSHREDRGHDQERRPLGWPQQGPR